MPKQVIDASLRNTTKNLSRNNDSSSYKDNFSKGTSAAGPKTFKELRDSYYTDVNKQHAALLIRKGGSAEQVRKRGGDDRYHHREDVDMSGATRNSVPARDQTQE